MIRICTLFIVFLVMKTGNISAQTDTLLVDLSGAEELFLKNNYELIAGNYQIDRSKAETITARLFENPQLAYENLFYNRETGKLLQTSYQYGQYAGSVSQLIKLAGKRNKNIQLSKTGEQMAELEYFDLMRTLKFELRNSFYKTYFLDQSLDVYREQINATEKLISVYDAQLKMGNVALKDLIRIKSLVYKLRAEFADLLNEQEDNYQELRLLCGIGASTPLRLTVSTPETKRPVSDLKYTALLDSARLNRADLQLAKTNLLYQQNNLKLQRSLAVPDVEISLSYDLKGNYPDRYTGIGISIPIPLFNRNQGEIKKARIDIDAAGANLRKQELTLENEVFNSYNTALRTEQLYGGIETSFKTDFGKLVSGIASNLKERNITLLEFLDLFDSYKENTLQMNDLQFKRMAAREEINYVTGSNIFN